MGMADDKQGRPLPPNLYQRGNGYRYKTPSGAFVTVKHNGKLATYEQACHKAEIANARRGESATKTVKYWHDEYIKWAESNDPNLVKRPSWPNRKRELALFAERFGTRAIANLTLNDLRGWWDGLSYDQQHNRRGAHSKFYQYAMSMGAAPLNPFTTADDAPKLLNKGKPPKSRSALELGDFWKIYNSKHIKRYPHVKIAMGIALVTGMREGDICSLRLDRNYRDNHLVLSVGKSVGQRGSASAAHHSYNLSEHTALRGIIAEARQLALKHHACPFIVSAPYRGTRKQGKRKEHICQVLPNKLGRDFATVRDLEGVKGSRANPPSFHEIKGLYIALGLKHYTLEQMQQAAAHVRPDTTLGYPAGHEPDYTEINVVMDSFIGGEL
jgi:integrase